MCHLQISCSTMNVLKKKTKKKDSSKHKNSSQNAFCHREHRQTAVRKSEEGRWCYSHLSRYTTAARQTAKGVVFECVNRLKHTFHHKDCLGKSIYVPHVYQKTIFNLKVPLFSTLVMLSTLLKRYSTTLQYRNTT